MVTEIAGITRGESLWEKLDVVRDAGSHGAKTTACMANFLFERAAMENVYGEVPRALRSEQNTALHICDVIPKL